MPIKSKADKMTIDYFCSNHPAFKKKAAELIEQSSSHEWVWERSSFSDPQDYNELHLAVVLSCGGVKKLSQYEAGY